MIFHRTNRGSPIPARRPLPLGHRPDPGDEHLDAQPVVIGAVLRTRQAASLRAGSGPVHAFVDGYHTGLLVTIALMAAGVLVSYLTLRPRRAGSAGPAAELTAVGEIEAIGESLGELVIPEEFTAPTPRPSA
jgi:hypothetical protein